MKYWCVRFSDSSLSAPTTRERAEAALARIDADRRPFCSLVCLVEVADGEAETMRPPRSEQVTLTDARDPFAPDELERIRAELRADKRRRFEELAAAGPAPEPCKHCGRLVLAGVCCEAALRDAREIRAGMKEGDGNV